MEKLHWYVYLRPRRDTWAIENNYFKHRSGVTRPPSVRRRSRRCFQKRLSSKPRVPKESHFNNFLSSIHGVFTTSPKSLIWLSRKINNCSAVYSYLKFFKRNWRVIFFLVLIGPYNWKKIPTSSANLFPLPFLT